MIHGSSYKDSEERRGLFSLRSAEAEGSLPGEHNPVVREGGVAAWEKPIQGGRNSKSQGWI